MHTAPQLQGLEAALERRQQERSWEDPVPMEGLGALGRSSHGGACAPTPLRKAA